MSDAPKSPRSNNKPRRRNNNRKRHNNNRNNNKNVQTKGGNNNTPQKTGNNNRRRHSNNKNRRPKALTPARILQKYDNLMEQYLLARKKFFDLFGRANQKQFNKVEKNYQSSLENLRKFETDLKEDWQKEVLAEKINGLPEDRQFSSTHDLPQHGDEVSFVGEFEDPHLLDTQKSQNWAEDTEETEGTMDDYYSYKGISPPAAQ